MLITIVDVGARGGLQRKWLNIEKQVQAHMFEPEPEEYNRLYKELPDNYKVYNIALSDKKEDLVVNICNDKMLSSVLEYDVEYMKKYSTTVERFKTEKQLTVKADTLDSLNIDADFIKVDVEGYAFPVLKGAEKTLENCIGVEAEVDFLPVRKNQSCFGEMYSFLTNKGFILIDFFVTVKLDRIIGIDPKKLNKKGTFFCKGDKKKKGGGQVSAGNPVWLRPPEDITSDKIDKAKIIYKVFNQEGYLKTLRGQLFV